ncbi:transcriptional regulator, TetR family [Paenibacillus uliginis N3/975]|uniref:Transcriptional regulator, TetR family n=1 Tax=Paenibacillus uliginis N3/975 TaxID=1313296 RepID=A0A1X7GB17_9BACL|nr:TetR/AcrR family transcriptional regulator [Paenibacillus uliginis]SMF66312.1 transcriptional regulator, TetR family [Paenibacillus uliginis N3/975]
MTTDKALRKRDLILDKAKELFIQRGYAATSMDDLVHYIGVSKGSIYYHFKSKEELFLQLLARQNREWMDAWTEKQSSFTSFEEKLYGIAEHMVDDFQNPLAKVGEEFYISNPDNKSLLDQILTIVLGPRKLYREIFLEGAKEGFLPENDVDEISVIFASMLDGLSTSLYERSTEELRLLYRKGVGYFLHGVMGAKSVQ